MGIPNHFTFFLKMYHRFQVSSDLLENQNEYAHAIIPFCKATGIELPKSLAKLVQEEEKGNEIFFASKQKEKNKLLEENIKHGTNSSKKNNTEKSSITEEIKSAATIEKVICEKKTVEFEEKDNDMLSNMCKYVIGFFAWNRNLLNNILWAVTSSR